MNLRTGKLLQLQWREDHSLHNKNPVMFHVNTPWGIKSAQCITSRPNHYVT